MFHQLHVWFCLNPFPSNSRLGLLRYIFHTLSFWPFFLVASSNPVLLKLEIEQNHLGDFLKQRLTGYQPQSFWSCRYGVGSKMLTFLTLFQGQLLLLVWRSHLENYCWPKHVSIQYIFYLSANSLSPKYQGTSLITHKMVHFSYSHVVEFSFPYRSDTLWEHYSH